MSPAQSNASLTELLRSAHQGDRDAADQAYRVLYPELCKIARAHLRVHQPETLLDTQGLVFESYLKLVNVDGARFENRRHRPFPGFPQICSMSWKPWGSYCFNSLRTKG